MKRIVLSFCTFLLLFANVAAQAAILTFTTTMTGPKESPRNDSPGIGTASLLIDDVAGTMAVLVNWTGLTGTTTIAHIHCCTALPLTGTASPATVVPTFPEFPVGTTSGSYQRLLSLTEAASYNPGFITANGGTVAGARAAFLAGLASERAYFNIHTTAFGGGEIRGFFTAVPEPGGIALLAIGAAGLGFLRRRVYPAAKT